MKSTKVAARQASKLEHLDTMTPTKKATQSNRVPVSKWQLKQLGAAIMCHDPEGWREAVFLTWWLPLFGVDPAVAAQVWDMIGVPFFDPGDLLHAKPECLLWALPSLWRRGDESEAATLCGAGKAVDEKTFWKWQAIFVHCIASPKHNVASLLLLLLPGSSGNIVLSCHCGHVARLQCDINNESAVPPWKVSACSTEHCTLADHQLAICKFALAHCPESMTVDKQNPQLTAQSPCTACFLACGVPGSDRESRRLSSGGMTGNVHEQFDQRSTCLFLGLHQRLASSSDNTTTTTTTRAHVLFGMCLGAAPGSLEESKVAVAVPAVSIQ